MKKLMAWVLAFVMCLSVVPASTWAAGDDDAADTPGAAITASVESTIFGNGYYPTMKNDGLSEIQGEAAITLDVEDVDASLIDIDDATVELVDGDGYLASEWILKVTELDSVEDDGTIIYKLDDIYDLLVDNSEGIYTGEMGGASRGWNAFGGDGNGCYTFYVEVSGITYDGSPVETVKVPIEVYVYGRDGTDRGEVFDKTYELPTAEQNPLNATQTDEIQWTYAQEADNGMPILCDDLTDDFYITWPAGTDASGITEDDVTITLYADDDEYTLVPVNAYGDEQYQVYANSEGETQISVSFMHWAYVPVFKTMTIAVDDGQGLKAEYETDIASVYVYLLQSGGTGSYPGNTVTYNIVGLDYDAITDVHQIARGKETYTLSVELEDGTYYICEDEEEGNIYLKEGQMVPSGPTMMIGPPDEAKVYTQYYSVAEAESNGLDASVVVEDPREPQINGYTVFSENRYDQVIYLDYELDEETMTLSGSGDVVLDDASDYEGAKKYVDPATVDGMQFTKTLGNGTGNDNMYTGREMIELGVNTMDGYTLAPYISPYDGEGVLYSARDDDVETRPIPYEHWSWQSRYKAGWVSATEDGTGGAHGEHFDAFPYVSFPYGYAVPTVSASADSTIFGNGQRDMRGNATITLDVDDADAKLIDTSKVTMELVAGDGYTPEEWILSPENLEVSVEDGTITFTPAGQNENGTGGADILAVNNSEDVYEGEMGGASRGWNQFGGDGNGCYTFYMEISGITYDGTPVDTVKVPIEYYIYGRDGTDRGEVFDETYELPTAEQKAQGLDQTDEIQWTYAQAEANGNVPNLTDDLTDDFYVTWPAGTDASAITEDDVTITLYADDAEYTLVPVNAYGDEQYQVYANSEGETQISVSFMHWAYVPVFKTMTISVDGGEGLQTEKTYDVVSVYVYLLQAGGTGSWPGNVVTFNVVGIDYGNIDDVYQLAQGKETYTLSTTIDGTDYYIMKDGTLEPAVEVASGPSWASGPPEGAAEWTQYYSEIETEIDKVDASVIVDDPREPGIDNYCIFSENRYDQVQYLNYSVGEATGETVTREYHTGEVKEFPVYTLEAGTAEAEEGAVLAEGSDSDKSEAYIEADEVPAGTMKFTKFLGNGTGNGMLHTGDEMVARGVTTLPGYTLAPFISPYDGEGVLYSVRDDTYDDDGNVIDEGAIPDRPIPYEHWAWQSRFAAGWVSNAVSGNDFSAFPYVSFPYGYAATATAEAESTLFGYAYTGGVTCIIEAPLDSMTGEATITLTAEEGKVNDSLIDSSNAVVSIADGDGYHADEMKLTATTLEGEWENGQITYTLSAEDLDWNNEYIYGEDNDSTSLEWSVFGGDGNGCYTFNFEVSGIIYNGEEVDPITFPVQVYIFGRDASDLGKMNYDGVESAVAVESPLEIAQTDEVQWAWKGDASANYTDEEGNEVEKPILCDNVADDFYVIWPEGTDASAITADDVTVTLYSDYGDSYTLSTETAYGENEYSVFAAEDQTQIAVTFMHWPYVPVYTTMTIAVDDGEGLMAETTYEIGSVYIYMVQSGGMANHDGQVVTFDFYGIDPVSLTDVHQLVVDQTYTLALYEYEVDEDGNYVEEHGSKVVTSAKFLCEDEDEDGNATLTLEDGIPQMGGTYAAPENAIYYNATEDRDPQLVGTTVYVRNRLNQTETVEIDGKEVELVKVYTEDDGDGNLYHDGTNEQGTGFADHGIVAARGYVMCDTIYPGSPHSMWAWSSRFLSGWTSVETNGTTAKSFPYVSYPYGYAAGEETEPEETEPEETEPQETEPEETEPQETEPEETEPQETEPEETEPQETEPEETEPQETEPEETEPQETEPEETEPEETEPQETEPEPTEPETPTETEPTTEAEAPTTAAPTTAASSGTTAASYASTAASSTAVTATTTTKLIQLRAIGGTKRVTLKWNKVSNADGYLIYGARCGVGYQVIADVTDGATKKYVVDGLEKGKSYKYRVKAYKIVDGEQVILRSSNTTHVYTHGNKKYANAKKVTASKTSVSLSVGKTSTIKATITMANSKKKLTTHVKELRYRSNNKKVATVSSTGVITAVKAGTANIYAYSPNGRYAKIKVTVK